jgi:UDP-N-acetylmuramoylalanine-D-glutamate ligase
MVTEKGNIMTDVNVPIITVTGTKGKTTTVAVISDVLQFLGKIGRASCRERVS